MGQPLVADIIELEQLLARYAAGMTRDDIDAVLAVFTPDGTYRAFGATYTLADFPALVRAAPKGLFLTGTPALEVDGDAGTGVQTLCFVDQKTHAMRIGYYTDTYRRTSDGWRLQHAVDDVPAPQRCPRCRQAARPDPPRADRQRVGVGLAPWSSTRSGRPLDGWLDEHADALAPGARARRDARRRHGAARQGEAVGVRRRLDALGVARAGRRARWLDPAAGLPRRGADVAGPGRSGPLFDDRGPGADDDRLRAAGAGRRHGAPAAARRRDVVPGLLRAGDREQPRRAVLPSHPAPTTAGGFPARRSGPAWRSTRSAACS